MTSRERLTRLFRGERPDRPAIKLWGLELNKAMRHPAYREIQNLGAQHVDLVQSVSPPFNIYAGVYAKDRIRASRRETGAAEWVDIITEYDTGQGILTGVFRDNVMGGHGYEREFPVKEPEDLEKLLAMPYEPIPFDDTSFHAREKLVGDRGMTVIYLDHAGYALHRLIGSETFSYWLYECPELMERAIDVFSDRLLAFMKDAYQKGFRGNVGWVGPEVFIPPLASMNVFERYVFQPDKPLADLLHENGSRIWVHSHGKMKNVLARLADLGIDVLNPIEPPPMGDVSIEEAFTINQNRMTLEGNIETHDIMTLNTKQLVENIEHVLVTGHRIGRLILSPSSGYDEAPEPTELMLNNLRAFILEGVRIAEGLKGR